MNPNRKNWAWVHPQEGVIEWTVRFQPEDSAKAEARGAEVRKVSGWSRAALANDFHGPCTLDEAGQVVPLESDWWQAQQDEAQAKRQALDAVFSDVAAIGLLEDLAQVIAGADPLLGLPRVVQRQEQLGRILFRVVSAVWRAQGGTVPDGMTLPVEPE